MVLNIFTDASLLSKTNGRADVCAGFVAFIGKDPTPIASQYIILEDSTNNQGEALAVYMGITYAISAIQSQPFTVINLFSDSQWCIYSLTRWMHSWIKNIDHNGIMYNSSGDEVKNQNIFENIIAAVLYAGLYVNLFHTRGHINPSSMKDIIKSRLNFIQSNNINNRDAPKITDEVLMWIAQNNNIVDETTRSKLTTKDCLITNLDCLTFFRFNLNAGMVYKFGQLIHRSVLQFE